MKKESWSLQQAQEIAESVVADLIEHCHRIEIAGSIRRKRKQVGDIEIVCIPKEYDVGLFESGIATVINKWKKVKGELPCKYTQRIHPSGVKVDIFFAQKENWGLIYAIRTGSAEYSHKVLATGWSRRGYKSIDGMLHKNGRPVAVPDEETLFRIAGVDYIAPEQREL